VIPTSVGAWAGSIIEVRGGALWIILAALLGVCVAVDLWVHREPRGIPIAEGVRWTVAWVAAAAGFAGLIWLAMGGDAAGQFTALYLTEKSLSMDNMLVLAVLISAARVPRPQRHRVLMVGALLAIALRLALIVAGIALLERFEWLMYVFGLMLLVVGVRLIWRQGGAHAEDPPLQNVLRRLPARASVFSAIVLVVIADLAFALDSIPAALALSLDTFLVFSANAFAVIGLRALYFVVEGAIERFRFMQSALGVLLACVSIKMLLHSVIDVPVAVSLGVIVAILGSAGAAAWLAARRQRRVVSGRPPLLDGAQPPRTRPGPLVETTT
jgi:tellurite resistance protein TerC